MSDAERARARREAANAEIEAVRGRFLASMIDAEAHVDRAIVFFFAPDEYRLFIETMLDRLNLVAKISALRKILRFLGMHEEYAALVKEIDALRQVRNSFAHQAYELVGNAFMTEGIDFELYRKERLDLGPRVEDIIHLSDLQVLAQRSAALEVSMLELAKAVTEAHAIPEEYFQREGWDPGGHFGPAT